MEDDEPSTECSNIYRRRKSRSAGGPPVAFDVMERALGVKV